MSDRYLLISADGHAGPAGRAVPRVPRASATARSSTSTRPSCPALRHRPAEHRVPREVGGEDRRRWPAGRLRLRRPQREARRRGRGRRGAVPRRRRARHRAGGLVAVRLGSGHRPSASTPSWCMAGARAHNRWLADFCAKQSRPAHRRGRRADHLRDVDAGRWPRSHARARARPARRDDPDPVDDTRRPTTSRATSRSGAGIEELGLVLHTHSGAGPADYDIGPGFMADLRHRGLLVGGPARCGCCCGPACSSAIPACRYVIAENGAWWLPDIVDQDGREVRRRPQHREARQRVPREPVHEAQRVHRPQLLPRRLHPRASRTSPAATRSASATCCGATTSPIPRAPSPTRASGSGSGSRTSLGPSAERILGLNAAELYGIDVDALAPLVERIGPLVDDIHGDAPLQEIA